MATLSNTAKDAQQNIETNPQFRHPVHTVERIVEKIVPVRHDVFTNVPVEIIKYVDKIVEVIKEVEVKTTEYITKEVPVTIEKIVECPVEVVRVVEKINHQTTNYMKALLIIETLLIAYFAIKGL